MTLADPESLTEYRILTYAFVELTRLATTVAASNIDVVVSESQRLVKARANDFEARAKQFIEENATLRWHVRYLCNFARSEGWSGALESDSIVPESNFTLLAFLALGREEVPLNSFIKCSEIGFPIADELRIKAPWGGVQIKAAGVDAYLAVDKDDTGTPRYYMVSMDEDGAPFDHGPAAWDRLAKAASWAFENLPNDKLIWMKRKPRPPLMRG